MAERAREGGREGGRWRKGASEGASEGAAQRAKRREGGKGNGANVYTIVETHQVQAHSDQRSASQQAQYARTSQSRLPEECWGCFC